jgi:hypothetical protein
VKVTSALDIAALGASPNRSRAKRSLLCSGVGLRSR